LRARLALAFVAVAMLAAGLSTLLGNSGLGPRLSEAARARLQSSANRIASVASRLYENEAALTRSETLDIEQLSAANGLEVTIVDRQGHPVRTSHNLTTDPPEGVSAPIVIDGREIGRVVVAPATGTLLSPEEEHLRHSIDRLHLAAGAISVAGALIVAFLLAHTLLRPLRKIGRVANSLEDGNLDARVGTLSDPELNEVGHALDRLAESLAEEEEIRKRNVADIAHEFRTPVSGILSRVEATLDGVLDDRGNLEAIHTETLRLQRLLDDLARLAEAEQPGLLLNKESVDLAHVASLQAELFAPRFQDARIGLDTDIAPVRLLGDPDRLAQVIANLLDNALRYTDSGGTVTLRVAPEQTGAVLEVSDTGIGIREDDLKHLFKRFWRGERSRSRKTGGAGIGLAIVQELVRAHAGTIEVESEPGTGSTFRIHLPSGRPGATRAPDRARPEPAPQNVST